MRFLVTRPERPGIRTAERLVEAGHDALRDPLVTLRFFPPKHLVEDMPDALIVTSASAVRGLKDHPDLTRIIGLPVWTVGGRTTEALRDAGFTNFVAETPDAARLASALKNRPEAPTHFVHIAGMDRAADFSELLSDAGHRLDIVEIYSADPAQALSDEAVAALSGGAVDAVLHYSRRTAEIFVRLVKAADLREKAFALQHFCLSDNIAKPLRVAGAGHVQSAAEPNEDALFDLIAAQAR
jgi:uroporphyrinogen-III synthase